MAPVIRISDDTFAMLQQLAQPLVDTPDSVLNRVLTDHLKAANVALSVRRASVSSSLVTDPVTLAARDESAFQGLDPDAPPNLTHTTVQGGTVDGSPITSWNQLVRAANGCALASLKGDVSELIRRSPANVRAGYNSDDGFVPHPNLPISVQGIDTNRAWKVALALAKEFSFPISVEFRWEDRDDAARPSQRARLAWVPPGKARNRG